MKKTSKLIGAMLAVTAAAERAFQGVAFGIDRHDRPLEAAFHQVARDQDLALAAVGDQGDGVGFEQVIEIANGHGRERLSVVTAKAARCEIALARK